MDQIQDLQALPPVPHTQEARGAAEDMKELAALVDDQGSWPIE